MTGTQNSTKSPDLVKAEDVRPDSPNTASQRALHVTCMAHVRSFEMGEIPQAIKLHCIFRDVKNSSLEEDLKLEFFKEDMDIFGKIKKSQVVGDKPANPPETDLPGGRDQDRSASPHSRGRCSNPNRPIGGLCQHSKRRDSMANTAAHMASAAQEVTKTALHKQHGTGT